MGNIKSNIHEVIENIFGISTGTQEQLLLSIILFIFIWIARRISNKLIIDRLEDYKERYFWGKTLKTVTVILAILVLSRIWFGIFESVGTFIGLLSAGLAIAFKDLLVNIGGWLFITTRKPFKIGDRIQIGDVTGDVIDIRLFQSSVIEVGNWVDADQSTGRIIHIPNGLVFTLWQANYTEGFEYIWNEIPVLLTFESDWKKAKTILTKIVNEKTISLTSEAQKQIKDTSKKFMIFYHTLTPIVYTSVKDSGIMLTMRYICHVRKRRGTEEVIWETVLEEFAKYKDIDFAYPTTRYYDNKIEGKHITEE
ncbi:MAG: mechanosensitive ion channel family protein [Bacteroidetes bacterium]|nr:mechanosensitive ion channel family protein [Bacteroidota bacterium]MBU1113504.1 mechanosensitive ion channel family protein [Bacteroidota bacterium]MBU1798781.1 mechanosensitive ion channel family protein [Bacteroidota bacterium]